MSERRYVQVITTIDKKEAAETIAKTLVEIKLAACVQILGPISSTYYWQGKLETAEEWQCLIKSRADRYQDLEAVIKTLHPYEVPEIIMMPIIGGNEDYLKWLDENIESGDK
jgi:periplasmic divalent cation tolerance protein